MRPRLPCIVFIALLLAQAGCNDNPAIPDEILPPEIDRHSAIPSDVAKITPEQDKHPPVLHSVDFHEPVPVPVISTAGGEDAPFIPQDRAELYFFFAADIREDASVQVQTPVNGIWVWGCRRSMVRR